MALQAPLHSSGSRPKAFLQRQTTSSSLRFVSFTSSTSSFSYTASAITKSSLHSLSSKQIIRSTIPKGAEAENVATAMPPSGDRMLVMVPPHPLIKHLTSVLRNEETPPAMFKSAMAELGRFLIYEACRDWLPMIGGEIQSPLGVANVEFVDPREPVAIIPILRAGLALAEHAATLLPATKTYHLGMSRDEETLQPSTYLNKIPEKFPAGSRVLVIDPMLATGGTIVAALDLLKEKGLTPKQIKVISAVSAPPALEKLSRKFPGLHVYTAMIDPVVNEKGFIVPGLGDAGDRCYGN
ncbi:uracil phosphoribosyltransferase-like [Carex rostrata]